MPGGTPEAAAASFLRQPRRKPRCQVNRLAVISTRIGPCFMRRERERAKHTGSEDTSGTGRGNPRGVCGPARRRRCEGSGGPATRRREQFSPWAPCACRPLAHQPAPGLYLPSRVPEHPLSPDGDPRSCCCRALRSRRPHPRGVATASRTLATYFYFSTQRTPPKSHS